MISITYRHANFYVTELPLLLMRIHSLTFSFVQDNNIIEINSILLAKLHQRRLRSEAHEYYSILYLHYPIIEALEPDLNRSKLESSILRSR